MGSIRSVRTMYGGTWFASTLEADWAATFDGWGWYWEYEPEAVRLPDGTAYRPDFRLPAQGVWCEVKGPHNERLNKARQLQAALQYEPWHWASDLVVVLRPSGPGEVACWEGVNEQSVIGMMRCHECDRYGFIDCVELPRCRYHISTNPVKSCDLFAPADEAGRIWGRHMPFIRAPRPGGNHG